MSSIEKKHGDVLLQIAHQSIQHGLTTGQPLSVKPEEFPRELQAQRASFVTLEINNQLRGCIGGLVATMPLVNDVAEHAFAAAFSDPRFPKLQWDEFPLLDIHISVLNPSEPMTFKSEEDLLAQLRPGIDGLIISEGHQRATFLPSVWESLPEPREFLAHLKQKAGLPRHYWSDTIQVERYTTDSF